MGNITTTQDLLSAMDILCPRQGSLMWLLQPYHIPDGSLTDTVRIVSASSTGRSRFVYALTSGKRQVKVRQVKMNY